MSTRENIRLIARTPLATDDQNCYTAVDMQANVIIILLLLISAI